MSIVHPSLLASTSPTPKRTTQKSLLLQEQKVIPQVSFTTDLVTKWSDIEPAQYDLGLSCEVFQRVEPSQREEFARTLAERSNRFVIFAPNAGNESHVTVSGLNTVDVGELVASVQAPSVDVSGSGYVDCPPFPPGLHFSNPETNNSEVPTLRRSMFRVSAPLLTPFCYLEPFYPPFIRGRMSHIVWVSGKNDSSVKPR